MKTAPADLILRWFKGVLLYYIISIYYNMSRLPKITPTHRQKKTSSRHTVKLPAIVRTNLPLVVMHESSPESVESESSYQDDFESSVLSEPKPAISPRTTHEIDEQRRLFDDLIDIYNKSKREDSSPQRKNVKKAMATFLRIRIRSLNELKQQVNNPAALQEIENIIKDIKKFESEMSPIRGGKCKSRRRK